MEILDLKIFCDLIELKSFTNAAEKNFLTQSAVSQRINRLNEYYGNKLFIDKKRLVLSDHGKYLYKKFKEMLNIYITTENVIDKKPIKDTISIGFSENAKIKYINKGILKGFLSADVIPEIYIGPSQGIYEKVLFGTLDYGIIGGSPQNTGGLVFEKLYEEKIVLVTSSQNATRKDLLDELPLILDHRDSGLYQFLKNRLHNLGKDIEQLNIKGYVGTSSEKLLLLDNSDLYCFLPQWYLDERPDLSVVPFEFDLIREFYEIFQKKNTRKVVSIRDIIRNTNDIIT